MTPPNKSLTALPLLLLTFACTPAPRPIPAAPAKIAHPAFPTPPANLMRPLKKPSFLDPTSTPATKPM